MVTWRMEQNTLPLPLCFFSWDQVKIRRDFSLWGKGKLEDPSSSNSTADSWTLWYWILLQYFNLLLWFIILKPEPLLEYILFWWPVATTSCHFWFSTVIAPCSNMIGCHSHLSCRSSLTQSRSCWRGNSLSPSQWLLCSLLLLTA